MTNLSHKLLELHDEEGDGPEQLQIFQDVARLQDRINELGRKSPVPPPRNPPRANKYKNSA